jgi:SAM-dependent methyltransferase
MRRELLTIVAILMLGVMARPRAVLAKAQGHTNTVRARKISYSENTMQSPASPGKSHKHRVCPWWLGYLLLSPIRRLLHDPSSILAPYLREGMTVLDPGPGMGFFTLELARRVGRPGQVIAVDVQPKMIERLGRRAANANLAKRIDARVTRADSMQLDGLDCRVDFVLVFAVVHEMPDAAAFFAEAAATMKPGALMLLAEPSSQVSEAEFDTELAMAKRARLEAEARPLIRRARTALLRKTQA